MITKSVDSWWRRLVAAVCLAVVGLLAGCGGGGSSSSPDELTAGLPPEAVAVYEAFKDASTSYRFPVEDALRIMKGGDQNPRAYADALPLLQRLAANPTLTPEQKQALDALIVRLKSDLATTNRR